MNNIFEIKCNELFNRLQEHSKMVLSTSMNDKVTSRMMSIVIYNNEFYFQTDKEFRKYQQLKINPNVALCKDNIQIEGVCEEIGAPSENHIFCKYYQRYFPSSFDKYTHLKNERLFVIKPTYIQKWIYENGEPFIEQFDFKTCNYIKTAY